MQIKFAVGQSVLDKFLVAQSEKGLCAILFGDNTGSLKKELRSRFSAAQIIPAQTELDNLLERVRRLIESPSDSFDEPLDPQGTAFQKRVWQALTKIPAGRTATYAEIAESIGNPRAVRAVGLACGANPLAVVVPCHRVIKADGGLSGYRWGVERKKQLLDLESGNS